MSTKKFSLSDTPVKRLIDGKEYLLYRIMAEKSFDTFLAPVNKGEFGGLVSSEKTLVKKASAGFSPMLWSLEAPLLRMKLLFSVVL